jgi:hypothetical protein
MEGYPNLRFKLQNERVSVYRYCGSNVRPRQEALQLTSVHSGSTDYATLVRPFYLIVSPCILFNPPNYKEKIKKCRILKALSISSVTHTNTHSIIGNATTKYEEFL